MNYLAHLWLTERAGLPLAGAVLGDLVHGRLDGRFPAPLERSIRLHRRVDAVTDAHPLVAAARTDFAPGARRYAGIVLDLVHDYCLARDWPRYHGDSLAAFAVRAAEAICAEQEGFALAGRRAPPAWRMRRLLLSYAGERGIDRALRRTARWLKRPEGLLEAGRDWRRHAAQAAAQLPQLLQDLEAAARTFVAEGAEPADAGQRP
jgi:acyl carrier protein phosphodiesterase